jgi:hypothetical protein
MPHKHCILFDRTKMWTLFINTISLGGCYGFWWMKFFRRIYNWKFILMELISIIDFIEKRNNSKYQLIFIFYHKHRHFCLLLSNHDHAFLLTEHPFLLSYHCTVNYDAYSFYLLYEIYMSGIWSNENLLFFIYPNSYVFRLNIRMIDL